MKDNVFTTITVVTTIMKEIKNIYSLNLLA